LTHMRVYCFRCYWPSNLVFVVRFGTYIPNLRKIGQKLRLLEWTIGVSDRHTDTQTEIDSIDFYICSVPRIALERQLRAAILWVVEVSRVLAVVPVNSPIPLTRY